MLAIGLFSYNAGDPSLNHIQTGNSPVHNKAGLFGAYAAGFLDDLFGLASLIWPCIFAVLGAAHLSPRITLRWWRWTGFFLLALCLMTFASSFDLRIGDLSGGGVIGNTLRLVSTRYLSPFGAFLLWLFIMFTGIQMACNISWTSLAQRCLAYARMRIALLKNMRLQKHAASNGQRKQPGKEFLKTFSSAPGQYLKIARDRIKALATGKLASGNGKKRPLAKDTRASLPKLDDDDPFALNQELAPVFPAAETSAPDVQTTDAPEAAATEAWEMPPDSQYNYPETPKPEESAAHAAPETPQQITAAAPTIDVQPVIAPAKPSIKLFEEKKDFILPSSGLLDPPQPLAPVRPEDLAAKGDALMSCFNDFDIHGELARITPGPVVTMFEVRPAPGIRVSKIANLSDDLSLALKAMAVRIQAPIPGSDTVGIEIPNDQRETVNFRELVESTAFSRGAGPLTMILGKDIAGHPFMADLARMPHMLVAGATGAGKSVCLNSILVSLLYRHPPTSLKLLLVDPKRIEMAVYADLPHLVHPVVTEMDDAKNALAWAVEEMENRFKTFMRLGVRNIGAYHEKLKTFGNNPPENLTDLAIMPYMVIVIDELADLMLTAAREVEPKIQRLSQLARAAGIHMILATQRPSVDVVTGLIKAQFPCRISFQVSSKHDSRTILDQVGAEHLLGRGDMLFKPPGGKLLRLHGPFLSDGEVQTVVAHWKSQQAPDYQVDFSQWGAETASQSTPGVGGDARTDPLYMEARTFVLDQGRASISLLQRHLKIGFNRAARLMEQFERDGLIGPADGSKPRTVLK